MSNAGIQAQPDNAETFLAASQPAEKKWILRLYVAGQTFKSVVARTNLLKICEQYLPNRYQIDVVDLLENPHLAKNDQIIAIPTLIRNMPKPIKKIIGDLSNTERVLAGLDIQSTISNDSSSN